MLRKKMLPDEYLCDVFQINYKKLFENGIRLLMFDIDNTLKTYDEKVPSNEIKKLIQELRAIGFKICLVSNGRRSRVEKFNKDIKLEAYSFSMKPLPFRLRRVIRKNNVSRNQSAIIGDQVFTDIIAGKIAKVRTILVKPLEPKKTFAEKVKRKLENMVLKLYNN